MPTPISPRALQLAQWLEAQPQVERVYYPGLASHPQHALAMRQQGGSGGAVVSFIVRGEGAYANASGFIHVNGTLVFDFTGQHPDHGKIDARYHGRVCT